MTTRIGMCQNALHGTIPESLEWMAEHKFDGFQIWKGAVDKSGMSTSQVKSMADDLELDVSAVGGGPNLVDPSAADKVVDQFRHLLDMSKELGCGIVTAESKKKPDDTSDDEAWASINRTVTRICEHAQSIGAVLAIECSGACFIADHEDWSKLASNVKAECLKVNLDPANIILAGCDPLEAVNVFADHIVHTHAKDIVFGNRGGDKDMPGVQDVPAGEGLVEFPAYLRALGKSGYAGYLTVEMHAKGQEGREKAIRSADNLRRMLGQGRER